MEFDRADNHYVVRLLPPRPTFPDDITTEEQAVMAAHAGYYEELMKAGRIVVYGPVRDRSGAWGLGVLRGESEDEVRGLVQADPAVVAGLMTPELGTMPVAIVSR